MSFQESVAPLRIKLHRSGVLTGFILLAHGGAIILSVLSLPLWTGLLLSLGVVCNLVYTLNRHVLMHGQYAIAELAWAINGDWHLITRDGKRHDAQLLRSTYLHARLVILNFVVDGGKRSIILLPDALDTNTFRRLRVRLQIEQYKSDN